MKIRMVYAEKTELTALPPFNFALSCEIFADGDNQIRNYENGRFWQVIRANGKLFLAVVKSDGTVDKPKLAVELKSDRPVTAEDKKTAEAAVTNIFSLGLDLNPFYEAVKDDKIMAHLTRELRGLKNPTTQTAFEAMVESIVEQQISLKVAHSLERRIIKNFGDQLNLEDEIYFAYPTPQQLASVSIDEFRGCGLSFRKAEYIQGAAKLIVEGKLNLEALKTYEGSEQIIRQLDRVRGVGVWTAEFTLLRGMKRLEALPADDLGLRRVISRYYRDGKPISSAEARRIAEAWGDWKGLAAYYLVVADMKNVEI
jgi:DNA-3-methyladenine glycosylase II